jgi:NADH-quinone oxidoreductase subunit I
MTHEKERLRDWMATVPPPPAADPHADRPKELDAARKAGEKSVAAERVPRGQAAQDEPS